MKWIVIEENPKPDNYIAVVLSERPTRLKIEKQAHSVFEDSEQALERARQLREHYGVRTIRIFHYDGTSASLK